MSLRLYYSSASPFVRKVVVAALERGVEIENLPSAVSPVDPDMEVVQHNPTGKIPCLLLDDDTPLFDSRVIAAYIDARGVAGPRLYPQDNRRFATLTVEALCDAMLDAALLYRYEKVLRPDDKRWDVWANGQLAKIETGLVHLETRWLATISESFNAGSIAAACVLGYLDFRFSWTEWRYKHPDLADWFNQVSARGSLKKTVPF